MKYNAKELRDIARVKSSNIEEIMQELKKAADNGYFSITWKGDLDSSDRNSLYELGYNVYQYSSSTGYCISFA